MGNSIYIAIAIVIGVLLLVLAVARLAIFLQWFRRDLRYVEKEIARTTGDEKKHWQKRKKRLWRSLIPFVRY